MLDDIEFLLKAWGLSPTREKDSLLLETSAGITQLTTSTPKHKSNSITTSFPGVVVTVRTPVKTELTEWFGKMAPMLNRYATLGALTLEENGVSVVSRSSLAHKREHQGSSVELIAAAVAFGAKSPLVAGVKIMQKDDSPPSGAPTISAWVNEDFERIKQKIDSDKDLLCNVGGNSMSIEIPLRYGKADAKKTEGAALLQMFTDAPHLVHGAGLLIGLELPFKIADKDKLIDLVNHLNQTEAISQHSLPHFGAWCIGRTEDNLGYVSFLPNLLKFPEIERGFAFSAISRARIAASYAAPFLEE